MRQEVHDFFAEHGLHVDRMIDVGHRKGLSSETIEAAAEMIYDKIHDGEDIPPIRMAWMVYERARHLAPVQKTETFNATGEILRLVRDIHYHLTTPWYTKLWRRWFQ